MGVLSDFLRNFREFSKTAQPASNKPKESNSSNDAKRRQNNQSADKERDSQRKEKYQSFRDEMKKTAGRTPNGAVDIAPLVASAGMAGSYIPEAIETAGDNAYRLMRDAGDGFYKFFRDAYNPGHGKIEPKDNDFFGNDSKNYADVNSADDIDSYMTFNVRSHDPNTDSMYAYERPVRVGYKNGKIASITDYSQYRGDGTDTPFEVVGRNNLMNYFRANFPTDTVNHKVTPTSDGSSEGGYYLFGGNNPIMMPSQFFGWGPNATAVRRRPMAEMEYRGKASVPRGYVERTWNK